LYLFIIIIISKNKRFFYVFSYFTEEQNCKMFD